VRKSATESAEQLVTILDEAFVGPAWHGPSLKDALRGVGAREARWLAGPDRPSTWALALHAAHAKYIVAGRLSQSRGSRFPRRLERPWWPRLPDKLDESHWRDDLALLNSMHEMLLATVLATPAARLAARRPSRRHTLAQETIGLALHDACHAGQIRLLRKLYQQRS
jgi:hypothetical protein